MKLFGKRKTVGEFYFFILNTVILSIIGLAMILPFTHVLAISLANQVQLAHSQLILFPNPLHLNFKVYAFIFSRGETFLRPFYNTVFVTVVGTFLDLVLVLITAYPLSKSKLKYARPLLLFMFLPMLFNPGIIPRYLVVRSTGLMDSLWALIVPSLAGAYGILLAVNFFRSLPPEIEESAMMDGAGYLTVITRIVLPLSKPIMATLAILMSVSYWNILFDAVLFVSSQSRWTLQLMLYQLVAQFATPGAIINANSIGSMPAPEQIRMTAVIVTTLPILVLYAFCQKYLVRGITVAAVKG